MRDSTRKSRSRLGRSAVLLAAVLASVASAPNDSQAAEPSSPYGTVLVVRGIFTVFSLGLDDLAFQLKKLRLDVHVTPAVLAYDTADGICWKYASGQLRGPIILIGHSLGADMLSGLARRIGTRGFPVDLMIMIDSTNPSNVPPNVRRCVNLYQSNASPSWFRIFRGAPIQAESQWTQLFNVDIRTLSHHGEADKIDHFNIDESPWIHQMVIREVQVTLSAAARVSPGTAPAPAVARVPQAVKYACPTGTNTPASNPRGKYPYLPETPPTRSPVPAHTSGPAPMPPLVPIPPGIVPTGPAPPVKENERAPSIPSNQEPSRVPAPAPNGVPAAPAIPNSETIRR